MLEPGNMLGEASGVSVTIVKAESLDSEGENSIDALDILCLASCSTQLNQENIEFSSAEVMPDPFNDNKMYCLHCLCELDKDQVSNHMVHEHGYRKILYKCQICLNTFELKPELTMHKRTCKVPPKRPKRKSLQQILKGLGVKDEYDPEEADQNVSCPICMFEMTKKELKDHVVEIHSDPDSSLACNLCNRSFKSKITLRDHVKLVHEVIDEQVPCETCGQVFRSKKYLSNHRRNVHPKGDKEFKCQYCEKQFKSHLCRHQHIKYVHPPESAMTMCQQCRKVFKSKINLHQHMRVAHSDKKKSGKLT